MKSEHIEQCHVVEYLRRVYPRVIFTATLGVLKLTIGMAMKIKRAGYQKSIPDLIILEPNRHYHGMVIEMKRKNGKLDIGQEQTLKILSDKKYFSVCCHSAQTAIEFLDEYMSQRAII